MRVSVASGFEVCDGRTDRVHLIPQRQIKTTYPHGAWRILERAYTTWLPIRRNQEIMEGVEIRELVDLLDDPRIIRNGCRRHHGLLDNARKLKIGREDLPESVEEFAEEFGFKWWLDNEYGLEVAA